jgi:hypothetical protein
MLKRPIEIHKAHIPAISLTTLFLLLVAGFFLKLNPQLADGKTTPLEFFTIDTDSAVQFAVIGDYGQAGSDEAAVVALINSWHPDFIITTGDNNYSLGGKETIHNNIDQYFGDYIHRLLPHFHIYSQYGQQPQ